MFQEMINGSIAVLSKPSVATFEEHEKDNLAWALIYATIAAVINAVIAGATAPLRAGQIQAQLEAAGATQEMIDAAVQSQGGLVSGIIGALIFTALGSLIGWGIIYGLGRAFGGTGSFGELAWGISLYSSPLSVLSAIVGLVPFVGGLVGIALSLYGLYLSYLAIQAGMNLPSQKALYVVLILFVIGIVIACAFGGLAAILALVGMAATQG